MKALVCGFGSIGRKHADNLAALGAEVRIHRSRAEAAAVDGYVFEPSFARGLEWCDAVVVATATDRHMDYAIAAARAGKALYIEKPLSHDRDGIDALSDAAKGLVVEVGCQLRLHPGVRYLKDRIASGQDGAVLTFQAWVGQRLDLWRPGTDYRTGYTTKAGRGGGALFDLVHEIDLIAWICGRAETVYADLKKVGHLDMETEDLANLVLTTESGATGVIQLDMVSPAYRRGMGIVCAKAVYAWDFVTGAVTRDDGTGAHGVFAVPDGFDRKNLLRDCMAHFLARINNPSIPPACSLEEGIHDLDILLAATESSGSASRKAV